MSVGQITRYDTACKAVADAKSVDEVKDIRDKSEAMRIYARQAKNKQLEIDASEIRFRAERRIGELMETQRQTVGLAPAGRPKENGSGSDPISKPITLAEAGIDKHLADRARKYAAISPDEFETILAERRQRIDSENKRITINLLEAGIRGTFGTGNNEWYTPAEYVEAARAVLGDIDLDPASSELAQKTVKAQRFFTAEINGLKQDWNGRVWLNPPYAQPLIADFADKMLDELTGGNVNAAIVLTNNYTDTTWFQKLARQADAICFTRGRIRFVSPNDEPVASPIQGQAFFYFGPDVERFSGDFAKHGFVLGGLAT